MTHIQQLFRSFEGIWNIHRVISTGEVMVGTALFEKCHEKPDTYKYHEKGELKTPSGAIFNVFRDYKYRFDPISESIHVLFPDERHFHSLNFEGSLQEAKGYHLCVRDNYDANYRFINHDNFEVSYKVKGPAKDYTIVSQFTKKGI